MNIATAQCLVIRFRNMILNRSTRFATVSFEIQSDHSWEPINRRIAWINGPGSAKASLLTALDRFEYRSAGVAPFPSKVLASSETAHDALEILPLLVSLLAPGGILLSIQNGSTSLTLFSLLT
jgi:hypothetical protein